MKKMTFIYPSKRTLMFTFIFLYFVILYNYAQRHYGWHGWFDQSQYLNEFRAIINFDPTPSNYYYFPLYPLLGVLSFGLIKNDPFLVANLACFIVFYYYYFKFIKNFIGGILGFFCILYCFYEVKTLMVHWAIPWTTTLVAPLLIYFFTNLREQFSQDLHSEIKIKFIVIQTIVAGLIFFTRPVDIIILLPSFLFLIFKISQSKKNKLKNFLAMAYILAMFIFALIIFNYLIYKNIFGSYFTSTVTNVGFYFPNIPVKFYSIFFDSKSLFNLKGEAIFEKMPILYMAIPSFIYGFISGGRILRLLIIGVLLQIGIYLAYSDFLPIGLWKFNNVHYFKFAIPIMIFLIFYTLHGLFNMSRFNNKIITFMKVIILSLPFYFTHIRLHEITSSWAIKYNTNNLKDISIQMNSKNEILIDKIDFPDISGSFSDIYFGEHSVSVGEEKLILYKDFRIIPLSKIGENQEGISLLFIRPVVASEIIVSIKNLDLGINKIQYHVYSYSIKLQVL